MVLLISLFEAHSFVNTNIIYGHHILTKQEKTQFSADFSKWKQTRGSHFAMCEEIENILQKFAEPSDKKGETAVTRRLKMNVLDSLDRALGRRLYYDNYN